MATCSICRSSRPLHQYQAVCRPGSATVVVHLPNLSLIDTVRLRLDPRPPIPSPFAVRIARASFRESFTDGDHVVYPVRRAAISLTLAHESAREHRLSVTVFGFDLTQTPDSCQLIDLLNLSVWFRERQLWSHVVYADLLSGLALIQSRSFLQASEVLYSASRLLETMRSADHDSSGGSDPGSDQRSDIDVLSICSREALLLLASAALYPTMMTDRLLHILADLCGQPALSLSDLHRPGRPARALAEIVTSLLCHELQPVRHAASRTLEFLLETIGGDCAVVLDHVIPSLVMIDDDADLVEPVVQAVLSSLYLMAADVVHDLVLDVLGPGLHQALACSLFDGSVGVCLRLLLGALTQLKAAVPISGELLTDLVRCYNDRYRDMNWVLDQIWDRIHQYGPHCLHQAQMMEILAGLLAQASTAPPAGVRRVLQVMIRMHGLELDRALDGPGGGGGGRGAGPGPYAAQLPGLVAELAQGVMSELGHGDGVCLDRFRLYWQALVLTLTLHHHHHDAAPESSAVVPDPGRTTTTTASLVPIAMPIIQAAELILRDASPKTPLLQVMLVVVPDLDPCPDLIRFLKRLVFWVPDTVQDEVFDLIYMLISRLRYEIAWEHIHDLVWIWCHRSTARSAASNRCRRLIQEIVVQSGSTGLLFEQLGAISDPIRYRDLVDFLTETADCIGPGSPSIDLVAVVACLDPGLVHDRYACRPSCLRILKTILANAQADLDTAVVDAVLASGQAMGGEPDPGSQLLVAELLGVLFRRRPWPWPYTTRAWAYLQVCDQGTNWANVRAMAQWASLALAGSHFSESGLDRTTAWRQPAQIWHDAADRAWASRSCWRTRLWGLKLIWIVSFRSVQVLRWAPGAVLDRIRWMRRQDPDPDVRLAAGAMIDLVDDVAGASLSACQTRLDPGSPPTSLTELSVQVPDLRPRPARSDASSTAPGLDDTGSDVSEAAADAEDDLHDGDDDDSMTGDGHDGRRQDRDLVDPIKAGNEAAANKTTMKVSEEGDPLPGSCHGGERPIRDDDLSDLSLIELQWVHDY